VRFVRSLINWDPFNTDRFFEDDWFPTMPQWGLGRVLRSMVNLRADDKKIKVDIELPDGADVDKLEAKLEDGVLSLTIPRKPEEKEKAKKVDVKVKK